MGQLLSNLANGSLVKLNENSQGKKFIKLDNDHYGSGTGVTMLRKDAFSEIAWNHREHPYISGACWTTSATVSGR